jgi:hypothetical protein
LTKENIGGHGAIRGVRIKVFCIDSVHAQCYASPPLGNVATRGSALRDSNCHADSESSHPLFRARIRNGVCAWNRSHTLGGPATRDENG